MSLTAEDWSPDRPFDMAAGQRTGILTHPSWLAAHSTNFDNHAIDRGLVAHIEHPASRGAAGIGDLIDHAKHALVAEVGDRDLCALIREQVRGRPPHPARGTGDEHDLARDGPVP